MFLDFVKHHEIDFVKWDQSIGNSYNENPYAYSHWLNMVSPGWEALINSDYSVLIPLPVKKKIGISYISQPRFTQQLGVFTRNPLEHSVINSCLNSIPKKFAKVYLQLNTENYMPRPELRHRITCCLNLESDYDRLYSNFSVHHQRNIVKAIEISKQKNHLASLSANRNEFYDNFKAAIGPKDSSLTKKDYDLMARIISEQGKIILCSSSEGEIFSGLFYLESKTKLVNLFNFTTPNGRENKSMYLILNQWIKQNSNQSRILDFEGSEIKSIAKFYNGFGAIAKNYQIFTKKGFWQM